MKKSAASFFVVLLLIISSGFLKAQVKIGIDTYLGIPGYKISNYATNGFGGDIYLKYLFLKKHLSLGAKAGYIKFSANSSSPQTHVALYPLRGNAEFYLLTKFIKPFIGADFGIYKIDVNQNQVNGNTSTAHSYYIGYAPLAGISIGLFNHFDLNFTARFEQLFAPADVEPTLVPLNQLSYVGFLGGIAFTF